MRKMILVGLVLFMVFMVVGAGWAKDKAVTITWTQVMPTPNDLKGWMVYYSETAGGPYKELAFVPFVKVEATYSYESARAVGKLGSKKARMYFVIRAVDNEGNVGAASSEVSEQVDGEKTADVTPPVAPRDVSVGKK